MAFLISFVFQIRCNRLRWVDSRRGSLVRLTGRDEDDVAAFRTGLEVNELEIMPFSNQILEKILRAFGALIALACGRFLASDRSTTPELILIFLLAALIFGVSSTSNESENSARGSGSLPRLESESSSESLNTFRNLIAAENEAEIYRRIRFLENGAYYNLPPQNTPGDYAALVRENFNSAINVAHFRSIFDREYFELQRKHHFLEDKLQPVGDPRHAFQRNLLEGVFAFLQDLAERGKHSSALSELLGWDSPSFPIWDSSIRAPTLRPLSKSAG
ncbi:hypothetical protein HAX54_029612 [Datura stramonium]|uniref:Uncharacterized protein n=1 Tax=Datura stramonium TaxID=4076 RepID=A0ABS8V779_DATST|nr:hypothetical protein [Datura stramonium]